MKKNINYLCLTLALLLTLIIPLKSEAGTGFALGLAVGSSMSTSNNQIGNTIGNNVLYLMPDLEKKLPQEEYLNIRLFSIRGFLAISTGRHDYPFSTKTITEIFRMGTKNLRIDYHNFIILKVEKFFLPRNEDMRYIFTYIEKNKLNKVE